MTLPVLDRLTENYPQAEITCLVGPRPRKVFENNPYIRRLIVYDKHCPLRKKIRLFLELRKEKFDMVVDLRNSLFGILLAARYKAPFIKDIPKGMSHMWQRHLCKLPKITRGCQGLSGAGQRKSLWISPQDRKYIDNFLIQNKITSQNKLIVVAPGGRSHIKRWPIENFVKVCGKLLEDKMLRLVLVGDAQDSFAAEDIARECEGKVLNLTGGTTIAQLAYLLKQASLLLTNDSACLHLGSYLNIPIVAIFGPTNELKYGPWSGSNLVVSKDIFCRPCEQAQCRFATLDCLRLVRVEDVLSAVKKLLTDNGQAIGASGQYKRILIIRTDRIGDVVLSTPVIKALRDAYPNAYIAMMVRPYTAEILQGNPYLDKIILYDKKGRHKNWLFSFRFARQLKKERFDLAVILHPTNRVHIISYLAGIRQRLGYNRKMGFLLNRRIEHNKQKGRRHESEYCLDLVRVLGIAPRQKDLFMPLNPASEAWAEAFLQKQGIKESDRLLFIHPGASCPSKIWPPERFAESADRLAEKYQFKVLLLGDKKDLEIAQRVEKEARHPLINLAGRTSLSQLASLFRRGDLFISNDSGPVHIASAVGLPVISIFGRNQEGLSPLRWRPLGENNRVLHKEIGCPLCLAHNCRKGFACLKAISVEEVVKAADSILKAQRKRPDTPNAL
jgi:heptosyltransferase-2